MEWIQSELLQPLVVEIIGLRNSLISSPPLPPADAALLLRSDSSSAPFPPFLLPSRVPAAVELSQLSLFVFSLRLQLLLHSDTTVAKILVGNKCDLENNRNIPVDEGKSLAEAEGLFFVETSALDSTNVKKKAFEIVIKDIYNNLSRKALNS
ncbi:hypothetical protein OPV22_008421 [Ensete ventricosum]|uniref:Small monomeric GTPase n=1 Tax=Ensete ventricosum TaxID=4639 RepID=A0AAV8R8A1_ENSVE|nr:hypothetical protein OPV22_008421 [Ensete ventricosum]